MSRDPVQGFSVKKCGLKVVMKNVLILTTKSDLFIDSQPEKNHRPYA